MHKARTLISALLLVGLCVGGLAHAAIAEPNAAAEQAPAGASQVDLGLSLGVSPSHVRLEEILSGVEQVSLSPVVTTQFSIIGRPQEKYWLRMSLK